MKKIRAACAAFIVSVCLVGAQGTTFQNYFAVGPGAGNIDYTSFLGNMISTMRGSSLTPVTFIPTGSSISVTNVLTFQNNIGHNLFSGFAASSSTLFTLNQFSREFWSPFWGSSNMLSGGSFGPALLGVRWGPGGKNDPSGYVYYSTGNANTTPINDVYIVANTYTFNVGSDSIAQGLNSFYNSFGSSLMINARYSLGSDSGCGNVNLVVPEPSTCAIMSIGLFVGLLSRKLK